MLSQLSLYLNNLILSVNDEPSIYRAKEAAGITITGWPEAQKYYLLSLHPLKEVLMIKIPGREMCEILGTD